MTTRTVRVRLTPEALAALRALASATSLPMERLCVDALETHLARARQVPWGRELRPYGRDLVIELSLLTWQRARAMADAADITVGQLCRISVEASLVRPATPRVTSRVA